MVQRAQVEEGKDGAVVVVALDLLVLVNVTVEVPGLEAFGVLFPLRLLVLLVPVAQPRVQHQVHLQTVIFKAGTQLPIGTYGIRIVFIVYEFVQRDSSMRFLMSGFCMNHYLLGPRLIS